MQGYYHYPTVSGERVFFVSEDDLWELPLRGGMARRMTSNAGAITSPAASPDGQHIAFIATHEGAPDLYVMPTSGGTPLRLTHDGARAEVVGWSQDAQHIIISSNRGEPHRRFYLYQIGRQGGSPQRLPLGEGRWCDRQSETAVVGRHTSDLAAWKRYKGGLAGELWMHHEGHWRMLFAERPEGFARPHLRHGRVWFISDFEGYGNLYSCDFQGGDLKRHTHHRGFYVRHLHMDERTAVYCIGSELWALDLESGEERKLQVQYASPREQLGRKFVDATDYLDDYTLHPRGHSLAITSRGKLYNFGLWEGAVRQSGEEHGVRYRLARYLDESRLLVISDEGGEERFEIHAVDSSSREVLELEGDDFGRAVDLKISPDGKHVALSNHRNELVLISLEQRRAHLIERSHSDRLAGFDWSPDSAWVAYALKLSGQTSAIKLVRCADRAIFPITHGEFLDTEPIFDPRGRYLYFISYREFNPVYGNLFFELSLTRGQRLCLVTLSAQEPSPFIKLPRPLDDKDDDDDDDDDTADEADSSGADESGEEDSAADAQEAEAEDALTLDLEGIGQRVVMFPLAEGRYAGLSATEDRVFFLQSPLAGAMSDEKDEEAATLFEWSLKRQKKRRWHEDVESYEVGSDGKTLALYAEEALRVLAIAQGPPEDEDDEQEPSRRTGWIDLERVSVEVDPQAEWAQMLREIWRLMRDHFWREDMSGVDWDEVWARYAPLVARAGVRSEFSSIVWGMQGELGTSHAYEQGGDYRRGPRYGQGFLGADTIWDEQAGGYRIEHIVRGDDWSSREGSPLVRPGLHVSQGDVILAVNGKRLSATLTPAHRLVNEARQEVELLILAAGTGETQRVTVRTLASEHALRYREWVVQRRALVHAQSEGQVGYVHIPDMGPQGYAEFHRGFASERERAGLVVDVRFNAGGHVSPLILEKLMRRPIGFDYSRHGHPLPYPNDGVAGPVVALTNEYAGSDGDIFSHAFKLFGIGPLMGKRTWGGVIGIWPRHEMVDGTVTTQPEFSFWFEDVGFEVENWGTQPDVVVENPPDADARGEDVQLRAAVARALQLLEGASVGAPKDPGPYPSRRLP